MDAFYTSVEQSDNPKLKGKPLVVGGSKERGVIAAASYEARKFGIKSAMSGRLAKKLCPDLIFVKPNFNRYREISQQIKSIFFEFTDLVEPLSLDEAYLDVTINKQNHKSASIIAQNIRDLIEEKTGLQASAGISINKFVAKIASDFNKPNGQKTVRPEEVLQFLEKLDIKKFYGIGKVTQKKMYDLGIYTGLDLRNQSLDFLKKHFKNSGAHYYNISRGIHNSEVKSIRTRKSIGAERTFTKNLTSEIYLKEKLRDLSSEVSTRLESKKLAGKTITLKIKYSDFTTETRSKTLKYFIKDHELIFDESVQLLFKSKIKNSVRLIGISFSNLNINKDNNDHNNQISIKF